MRKTVPLIESISMLTATLCQRKTRMLFRGIENILKFIRIDYVCRLTYIDHMAPKERGFIRMELRFTL